MDIRKNEEFELNIVDMSDAGEGIGKQDGYIWFVKDAVIGDRIRARAMKMKRNYGFARLVEVLEPSAGRVVPRCPVARQCGGCQLQMMDYQEQLRMKERKVYNNLRRIGGLTGLCLPEEGANLSGTADGADAADRILMEPIMGMEDPWRYRNKAQFPFGRGRDGQIAAGFYAGRTHCIIETEDCLLGVEENRRILQIIKKFMEKYGLEPYDEERHRGLVRHALIRKGFATGELMVCLVINGKKLPQGEKLVQELLEISGMTSISYNINEEKTNVILGNTVVELYGPGYIRDEIGGISYQISPLSFYQVNPRQTERLYRTALEYADLTGNETVWDLYCGIGTISLFLAQRARKVYGVEIVPQAIEDARRNASLNQIENAEFFVGKAEEVLPQQYAEHQIYADVIVVDPPRKGCDAQCLDTIVKMQPERVVYVSCDSATLARDVKYLGERGYVVKRVRCCDMFGHSGHVETVCLLTQKRKGGYQVEIEIPIEADGDKVYKVKPTTYTMIKQFIREKHGVKAHTKSIAEVKRDCGLEMRLNYNKSKKENPVERHCTPKMREYIMEAFEYYNMV